MSYLRDSRTTLTDQDAFWRRWVNGERKLQGVSYPRAKTSLGTTREAMTAQEAARFSIRSRGDDLRQKNDPFMVGSLRNSHKASAAGSRRDSLLPVRDSLGYRVLQGGEAGGGMHMYPKTLLHETLHQLPVDSSSLSMSSSWRERTAEASAELSMEFEQSRSILNSRAVSPQASLNFDESNSRSRPRSPPRLTLIPRSSSPDYVDGGGLCIVQGTAQLGFRSAGRHASTQALRPPSPPRTELSPEDPMVEPASVWNLPPEARRMAYEAARSASGSTAEKGGGGEQSMSAGITDPGGRAFGPAWHGWGSIARGEGPGSVTALEKRMIKEELLRSGAIPNSSGRPMKATKDFSVSLRGQPVKINAASVTVQPSFSRKPKANWERWATTGIVDMCRPPDEPIKERLRMMQEGYPTTVASN